MFKMVQSNHRGSSGAGERRGAVGENKCHECETECKDKQRQSRGQTDGKSPHFALLWLSMCCNVRSRNGHELSLRTADPTDIHHSSVQSPTVRQQYFDTPYME